jgi:hypothetical protein
MHDDVEILMNMVKSGHFRDGHTWDMFSHERDVVLTEREPREALACAYWNGVKAATPAAIAAKK